MKKLLIVLACLICLGASGQTYNPAVAGTTSNKPYAPAQGVPTDSRTYFYDAANFAWRPYQNTTEVLTYLNLPKYRVGQFPIVVNTGGILGAGTLTGGINTLWYFKNGQADSNLVVMIPGSSGGGTGTVTIVTAETGFGIGWTISNPTTIPDITLTLTYGGDISGATNAITVNKFNGQLPAFYLNYNNLFNTPTIPAQVNLTGSGGITVTGTYPNLVIGGTSGFSTAGVDLIALSSSTVGLDTLHYRKVDSLIGVNDSTLQFILNGLTYSITLRGGAHGSGPGSGSVTQVSVVPNAGVSASVANPTSTPALTFTLGNITPTTVNGLTFAAISGGATITGGSGTPHTLTFSANANVSGTNTGDISLAGENYLSLSAQVLTANPVNVSGTNITGILKAAAFPALAGDLTNSGGSLTTTISNNVVTNAKLATAGSLTIKGNNTLSTGNELDLTVAQVNLILPVFTASLNGLVPKPTTSTGKVLSDAGTWVNNGAGNPNTKIGSGYWWVDGSTNQVKTVVKGLGVLIDSLGSPGALIISVDTTVIQYRGQDSIFLVNVGAAGLGLGYANINTVFLKKIVAGANVSFTQNNDSSITITATAGSGSGIVNVGTINSQALNANGLVISGTTIYTQTATATFSGMVSATAQTFGGAKTFSTSLAISTLTTPGGVFYGDGSGIFHQTGAGTATQVLHGGANPSFSGVSLTADVINLLPIASGGNGTAIPVINAGANISITGSWNNYTISTVGLGTVTNVSANGGTTGLSFTVVNPTTTPALTLGGDLNVIAGGSGLTSLSTYGVLVGGTTPTGPMQQVPGNGGTATFVLTSNGPTAVPTWQAPSALTPALTQFQVAVGNASNQMSGSSALTFMNTTAGNAQLLMGGTLNGYEFEGDVTTQNFELTNASSIPATFSGEQNTMIGISVGNSLMTGGQNTGLGISTLSGVTSGFDNTAIGVFALALVTTGTDNVGIGRNAGSMFKTGSVNIAIGAGALSSGHGSVSSSQNIEIGYDSAVAGTPGNFTYIGHGNKAYLPNHANFGSPYQLVSFGNNGNFIGANTATANAFSKLAGDIFWITDSSSYCMWNGSIWIRWGGSGSATPTLQAVLTAGSNISGTGNTITTGSSTNSLVFVGGVVQFQAGVLAFGLDLAETLQTANYNITTTDGIVYADATSGNLVMTLPAGIAGQLYTVKKIDNSANTVTVQVTGGGHFDPSGPSTYVLGTQNQAISVIANGGGGLYYIQSAYAGGISGALSGNYTPTLLNIQNTSAITAHNAVWSRVGNVVTVSTSITFTASNTSGSAISISLPITTNMTSSEDASGTSSGWTTSAGLTESFVQGDASLDKAIFEYTPTSANAQQVFVTFQYTVK